MDEIRMNINWIFLTIVDRFRLWCCTSLVVYNTKQNELKLSCQSHRNLMITFSESSLLSRSLIENKLVPDGIIASFGFSWPLRSMLELISVLDATCAFKLLVESLAFSCCSFAVGTSSLALIDVTETVSLSFEWRCSRPEKYKSSNTFYGLMQSDKHDDNDCNLILDYFIEPIVEV